MKPHRNHKAYWAFLGHRLSGLALALFLPFHFLVLATVLDQARFDEMIAWTEHPLLKFAEWGLVVALALHMLFGLRLLFSELTPWPAGNSGYGSWIVPSVGLSLLVGLGFLAGAL